MSAVSEGDQVVLYARHRYIEGTVEQVFPKKRSGEQVLLLRYETNKGTTRSCVRSLGTPERVEWGSVAVCCVRSAFTKPLGMASTQSIREVVLNTKRRLITQPKSCPHCQREDKVVKRGTAYWCTYCHRAVQGTERQGRVYTTVQRLDQDRLRSLRETKRYYGTTRTKTDEIPHLQEAA
jgi:ribosomal protein L37AE/L43A